MARAVLQQAWRERRACCIIPVSPPATWRLGRNDQHQHRRFAAPDNLFTPVIVFLLNLRLQHSLLNPPVSHSYLHTDQELLGQMVTGSEQAFSALYKKYWEKAYV